LPFVKVSAFGFDRRLAPLAGNLYEIIVLAHYGRLDPADWEKLIIKLKNLGNWVQQVK